ncbi:MAG TPA: alkaline phosphatase family protein [bacterium]|nr:alkaline phosphatase family protein [bacterium]
MGGDSVTGSTTHRHRVPLRRAACMVFAAVLVAAVGAMGLGAAARAAGPFDRIERVIVIYQENWSFDAMYGLYPGANGIANAGAAVRQVDKNGVPYTTLPQPIDTSKSPRVPDPRFPADLPVAPFNVAEFVLPTERTGDLVHRFYHEQLQIDGGKMDKFVAWSDAAGLAMSYYDITNMPVGRLAQQYVLADNYFHAAFGGSFLNHFWLVCACTPKWADAPASLRAQLDQNGALVRDGSVTPDGYAVNTLFSVNSPHPAGANPATLVPNQTMPNIGDRLSARGVSWAWYSGGWNDALAGHADPLFQFHHQVFAFFSRYADGTPGRAAHLKDERDFLRAVQAGTLPAVSFIKPLGPDNEHPGYADLLRGERHVADLVRAVANSPAWPGTVVIVTYDEHGGRWDHVAPPVVDRWGPGIRVPAIIISPLAKRHYVDHTLYDTTSILKLIETRWGLAPLGTRDAGANGFEGAFQ